MWSATGTGSASAEESSCLFFAALVVKRTSRIVNIGATVTLVMMVSPYHVLLNIRRITQVRKFNRCFLYFVFNCDCILIHRL